ARRRRRGLEGGLKEGRKGRLEETNSNPMHTLINRANPYLSLVGFGWLTPILRMATGDRVDHQARELWRLAGVPLAAFALFLVVWSQLAARIDTSLGAIPGPTAVVAELRNLVADHEAERQRRDEFYAREEARNGERLAADPTGEVRIRTYTGKPTYFDQIRTSLLTVFA